MGPSRVGNSYDSNERVSPSRRDFLKLAGVAPLAAWLSPVLARQPTQANPAGGASNVIILLFDAWSARNVSLYGYRRNTTPSLDAFAQSATVFHNHYSAGMYTTPGTASLLTGLLPWTHRALQLGAGVAGVHRDHQAFAAFHGSHSTVAYAHNQFADVLLEDASSDLDIHFDSTGFNLSSRLWFGRGPLKNDAAVAYRSLDSGIFQAFGGWDSSLFVGPVHRMLRLRERVAADQSFAKDYPLGLPDAGEGLFRIEDLVDGAIQLLSHLPEPSLTYLHFLPPHGIYRPTAEFARAFDDGWTPATKPIHPMSTEQSSPADMIAGRRLYDQYMASWDHEVGRLFGFLSSSGLLDRSYVVVTADHGEMFERGEIGHESPLLFDPLVHIPLVVRIPGQARRRDVYSPTSSIDVLPTLAHSLGRPVAGWAEGQLLPGLGGEEDDARSILSMDAQQSAPWAPLSRMSLSLTKNGQRLAYYAYPGKWQGYEFYDLNEDPEELTDLFPRRPAAAKRMQEELLQGLAESNASFEPRK